MNVTPRIKTEIAALVEASDANSAVGAPRITAEQILTVLVRGGVLEDEYELCDSEGNFDEHNNSWAQACVYAEIKRQLNN